MAGQVMWRGKRVGWMRRGRRLGIIVPIKGGEGAGEGKSAPEEPEKR